MSDSLKTLVIDRTGGLTDSIITQMPTELYVFARADSVVQAVELMTTESYSAIIFDLDQQADSYTPFFEMLGNIPDLPGVILVAEPGSRTLMEAEETALAHSLNIVAKLTRPLGREALMETLGNLRNSRGKVGGSNSGLSESEFVRGLMSDGLTPVFQPKLNISEKTVYQAEALARWKAPSGSLMGAGAILKLAKAHGHMDVLTSRMLELSFAQAGRWSRAGTYVNVGVNVNAESLYREDFLDVLEGLIDQHGIEPGGVTLEMNEADLTAGGKAPVKMLQDIKERGFKLALDDFSTGLTTLLNLSEIQFDEIVIDRRFMSQATVSTRARTILEAAIKLCKDLGMIVTCEGIETAEQLALISKLNADCAQGYLIAKPMSSGEYLIWSEDFRDGVIDIKGLN